MKDESLLERARRYAREPYGRTHKNKWMRMAATLGDVNGYRTLGLYEINRWYRIEGKRWLPFRQWAKENHKLTNQNFNRMDEAARIEYRIDEYGENPLAARNDLLEELETALKSVEKGLDVDISHATEWMMQIFDIADAKDTPKAKSMLAAPLKKLVFFNSNPDHRPPFKYEYNQWLDSIDLNKVPSPEIRKNLKSKVWSLRIAKRIFEMYDEADAEIQGEIK